MKLFTLTTALLFTLAASLLTGCGGTKVTSTNERSVGQQLIDLNEARNRHIITDKEYERLRKQLIKKND